MVDPPLLQQHRYASSETHCMRTVCSKTTPQMGVGGVRRVNSIALPRVLKLVHGNTGLPPCVVSPFHCLLLNGAPCRIERIFDGNTTHEVRDKRGPEDTRGTIRHSTAPTSNVLNTLLFRFLAELGGGAAVQQKHFQAMSVDPQNFGQCGRFHNLQPAVLRHESKRIFAMQRNIPVATKATNHDNAWLVASHRRNSNLT
jgi:hypothetical protein